MPFCGEDREEDQADGGIGEFGKKEICVDFLDFRCKESSGLEITKNVETMLLLTSVCVCGWVCNTVRLHVFKDLDI